jgi:hypothetical protein
MNPNGNGKLIYGVLLALAFGAGLGLALGGGARALDPAAPAQAQSVNTERVLLLSADGYFVTASSSGNEVFLWYFERKGAKAESKIYYVNKASASTGPEMK